MSALLVLPLWIGLFCQLKRHFSDWRDVAFAASACWGAGIVLLTEALSALSAISFWPLVIVWSLISLLALAPCVISTPRAPRLAIRAWSSLADPPLSQRILIAGIAFICLATVCVAVISPPNNWDSMTYHMARVANWMDHHSIRHYPAHSLRQLYLGPWAEFTILHLQILSGGDRFAALVQYVAMLGSVIGVSRVAEKLGADRMGQLLASVYCATLPMGILQASSTQNDYVVAFWLICFVNTALDLTGQGLPLSRLKTAIGGLSLGLAALTKMTALLFAAPFAVWIGALLWWRGRIRAVAVLGGMGILAAAINAPHMTRNWRAFESPLGPPTVSRYLNEVHSPAAVASNLIRNLALHAGGLPVGRGIVVAAVKMIHVPLRQDVDDRRTTFIDTRFGLGPALHEDVAGNPLHLLLAGIAVFVCIRSGAGIRPLVYAACIGVGFFLFCVFLKWQPFHSRLHLPLFVAAGPICGLVAAMPRFRKRAPAVGMILLAAAIFPATMNSVRPLASRSSILFRDRTSLYFASRPDLQAPYLAAAAELLRTPSARVGIICEGDSWEYPLRVLVRAGTPTLQFEHVDVRNSSRFAGPAFPKDLSWAEAVVAIGEPPLDERMRPYRATFVSIPVSVYRRSARY